jgi:hypothetical protein
LVGGPSLFLRLRSPTTALTRCAKTQKKTLTPTRFFRFR